MAAQYDPERPLPLAQPANQIVATTPLPDNVRPCPGFFPSSGSSPKRRRRAFYNDPNNSHLYVFQRRHNCPGKVVLACDKNGVPVKHKHCAQCDRKDAAWWCTTCRVFLHNNTPNTNLRDAAVAPTPPQKPHNHDDDKTTTPLPTSPLRAVLCCGRTRQCGTVGSSVLLFHE